jgi:hypothetical protein
MQIEARTAERLQAELPRNPSVVGSPLRIHPERGPVMLQQTATERPEINHNATDVGAYGGREGSDSTMIFPPCTRRSVGLSRM